MKQNMMVIQPQEGDQCQVGGPQVPLPGHGDEIETHIGQGGSAGHDTENTECW